VSTPNVPRPERCIRYDTRYKINHKSIKGKHVISKKTVFGVGFMGFRHLPDRKRLNQQREDRMLVDMRSTSTSVMNEERAEWFEWFGWDEWN
jgi:hypothetical protein